MKTTFLHIGYSICCIIVILLGFDFAGSNPQSTFEESSRVLMPAHKRRRLQFENMAELQNAQRRRKKKGGKGSKGGKGGGKHLRGDDPVSQAHALHDAVVEVEMNSDRYNLWWTGPPDEDAFKPATWGAMHRETSNAIFTMAVIQGGNDVLVSSPHDLILFLGSARKSGYDGDIVLAVEGGDGLSKEEKAVLIHYQVVVYEISHTLCSKATDSIFCGSEEERAPASVFRYFFYEKWAANYNAEVLLMLADFRDIVFQGDPFTYKQSSWFPEHQLAVFQEFHPNMVINRCRFNTKVMRECYGQSALERFGSEVIVSSGAILGSRDAVLLWSHHVSSQLQEAPGRQIESVSRCTTGGIDHAFVNWLVYGDRLAPFFKTKVFPMGEGAVNSLGGLKPNTVEANITGSLHDFWHLLDDQGWIRNWSGDRSPVVHQVEHFLEELEQRVEDQGHEHNDKEKGWLALATSRCLWGCKESLMFGT